MTELKVDIGGSTRGFQIATEDTKRMARGLQGELGQGAAKIGTRMTGMLSQLAAGFIGEEAIRRTIEFSGEVNDLSQKLGVSTDTIQTWGYALKQSGSDVEALSPFFGKLAQSRDAALAGNEKMIASFARLGVTIGDLRSKRLEDIGMKIAVAFKEGDTQKLLGVLKDVGGRGATDMVAAFKEGMAEMTEEATKLGLVIDSTTIARLDAVGDKLSQLGSQLRTGLAPALVWLTDVIQGLWRGLEGATATIVGLFAGFQKGSGGPLKSAEESMKELEAKWAEQDAAAKARENSRNKGSTVGVDDERATGKAAAERERLQARLNDLQDKNYLASLSKEQRITELYLRRVELADWLAKNSGKLSETGRLKAEIDLEQLKGSEASARMAAAKTKEPEVLKKEAVHVDSLSGMGLITSAGALTNPMLDASRKQLSKLEELVNIVKNQQDVFAP